MFDIEYKGGNTVVISTKNSCLVTDPKLSVVGLKDVHPKGCIELGTEERFLVRSEESRLIVEGPGEYEAGDFSIRGIPARRHIDSESDGYASTIYRVDVGDVRFAIIGNIDRALTDDQLESIGVVDVAVVPVGGNGYTLDAVDASSVIKQVDPTIIIPVHYADPAVKYEVPQADLTEFVKEFGAPIEEAGSKYKVKSSASLPQTLTVIKIDRS